MKKINFIFGGLALILLLSGCNSGFSANDMTDYVQGSLEITYLGKMDKTFLNLPDSDLAMEEQAYLNSISIETDYFISSFEITGATSDDKSRIQSFYKELYQYSKFEVAKAIIDRSANFTVKITIEPILFFDEFYNNLNGAIEELNAVSFESNSDYNVAWNEHIISMAEDQLATTTSMVYGEPIDLIIALNVDENGYYAISKNDFANIDELIIAY